MIDLRRMRHEVTLAKQSNQDPDRLFTVNLPTTDSHDKWIVTFHGPKDTPYEDGYFELQISIPETYPWLPPTATFKSRVYHPNVCPHSGKVHLDVLRGNWSPSLTIVTIAMSIYSIFIDPISDMAVNREAACEFVEENDKFQETARMWTNEMMKTRSCASSSSSS
jgi:ubiquitin-conjugating enzyme (huntingtin interacting protein 2)